MFKLKKLVAAALAGVMMAWPLIKKGWNKIHENWYYYRYQ